MHVHTHKGKQDKCFLMQVLDDDLPLEVVLGPFPGLPVLLRSFTGVLVAVGSFTGVPIMFRIFTVVVLGALYSSIQALYRRDGGCSGPLNR